MVSLLRTIRFGRENRNGMKWKLFRWRNQLESNTFHYLKKECGYFLLLTSKKNLTSFSLLSPGRILSTPNHTMLSLSHSPYDLCHQLSRNPYFTQSPLLLSHLQSLLQPWMVKLTTVISVRLFVLLLEGEDIISVVSMVVE